MPFVPRRYLIDVPGGREDAVGWEIDFDSDLMMNIMKRSVETQILQPYADAAIARMKKYDFRDARQRYLGLSGWDSTVVWINTFEVSWDNFGIPESAFSGEGAFSGARKKAKMWLNEHASIIGPSGTVVKIGYYINTMDLSDIILETMEALTFNLKDYRTHTIKARAGIIALLNTNTRTAAYELIEDYSNIVPLWFESIDIGPDSVGWISHGGEEGAYDPQGWYWKVRVPTPNEESLMDDMFKKYDPLPIKLRR